MLRVKGLVCVALLYYTDIGESLRSRGQFLTAVDLHLLSSVKTVSKHIQFWNKAKKILVLQCHELLFDEFTFERWQQVLKIVIMLCFSAV